MSFDRIAPFYRTLELVLAGGKLQRCRTAWLDEVSPPEKILLVGEGHGRLLETCVHKFPGARITCADASAAMLRIAQRRWEAAGGRRGTVEFVQAELPAWTPPEKSFDLIITNFFLDCFPPETLERVVAGLANAAAPGAQWLISDFAVPACGWRRWRAKAILALAYAFFRRAAGLKAKQITPPDCCLSKSGFQLIRRRTFEFGLLHSDLWSRSSREELPSGSI